MVLINKEVKVVVQGMTGKEGQRASSEMIDYGTQVVCGVTPGKGGKEVLGLPIFDSVADAKAFDSEIAMSVLFVPPLLVYDAAIEAISAGIKTLVIISENVPLKDTSRILEFGKRFGVQIIGPSSVGMINVGEAKIGSIGGSKELDMYTPGNVAIVSKSGGMCSETALLLSQNDLGQSYVIGIGGDALIGSSFVDIIKQLEEDPATHAIVIYGELGGTYEEELAEAASTFSKPIIAYVAGIFAETYNKGLAFGHAGAILEHGSGSASTKKQKLKEAGVYVCDYHYQIPDLIKKALGQ